MFNCFFCGWQAQNETSVFCPECGPSKNWTFEEVDQSKALQNYQKTLRSLFFQAKDFEIENISLSLRERLKISKQFHQLFLSILNKEKENINYLNQFRLEFDKNVIDAYAGHDTYLRFRFTNLSENHFYNITLHWDDPETTNEADLLIKCHHSITPGTVQSLGGSHIFPRMGIKEISDLRLKITNQFQESVIFRVTPFTFAVGSPDKFITNLTHNQISIEGRGVVDASKMGSQIIAQVDKESWIELDFNYLVTDELPESLQNELSLKTTLLLTGRKEKELQAQQEIAKLAREQDEKEEQVRQEIARLTREKEEQEVLAQQQIARLAREQDEKEEQARQEIATLKREKEEQEVLAQQEIAKLAREQDEKEELARQDISILTLEQEEAGIEPSRTKWEQDEEDKKTLEDDVKRFLEKEQKEELTRKDTFEQNEEDFHKPAILSKEYNKYWAVGFFIILLVIVFLPSNSKSNNQIPSQTPSIIIGGVANGTVYNFSISKHCKYNGILLQLGATNDLNIFG